MDTQAEVGQVRAGERDRPGGAAFAPPSANRSTRSRRPAWARRRSSASRQRRCSPSRVHGTPCSRPSGSRRRRRRRPGRRRARASSSRRRTTAFRLAVDLLDPSQVGLDHLAAGHLLAGDLAGQFQRPQLPQLCHAAHHGALMNRWIIGARPRTLPAAVVPVALGATAAVGAGDVVWWRVALALVVSLALQVGVNYANDYSDGVRGTDDVRVGPVRLVASGLASPAIGQAGGDARRSASPRWPDWRSPSTRRCGSWRSVPRRSPRDGSTRVGRSRTATSGSASCSCSSSSVWWRRPARPMRRSRT